MISLPNIASEVREKFSKLFYTKTEIDYDENKIKVYVDGGPTITENLHHIFHLVSYFQTTYPDVDFFFDY